MSSNLLCKKAVSNISNYICQLYNSNSIGLELLPLSRQEVKCHLSCTLSKGTNVNLCYNFCLRKRWNESDRYFSFSCKFKGIYYNRKRTSFLRKRKNPISKYYLKTIFLSKFSKVVFALAESTFLNKMPPVNPLLSLFNSEIKLKTYSSFL